MKENEHLKRIRKQMEQFESEGEKRIFLALFVEPDPRVPEEMIKILKRDIKI